MGQETFMYVRYYVEYTTSYELPFFEQPLLLMVLK